MRDEFFICYQEIVASDENYFIYTVPVSLGLFSFQLELISVTDHVVNGIEN